MNKKRKNTFNNSSNSNYFTRKMTKSSYLDNIGHYLKVLVDIENSSLNNN